MFCIRPYGSANAVRPIRYLVSECQEKLPKGFSEVKKQSFFSIQKVMLLIHKGEIQWLKCYHQAYL